MDSGLTAPPSLADVPNRHTPMQHPALLQSITMQLLRHMVPPALLERLFSGDAAAVDACAEAAALLHRELRSVAALIPAPLVREQLAAPAPGRIAGAYWRGSLLFADLSGFTALSEQLSALGKQGAEEISAVVNRLFAALVEEVHRFAGAPLKFGGDALTAFFDESTLGAGHAALACAAALAMQQRMDAFCAVATPVGQFRLQLRVGVHSGRVFAAQVGDATHIELVVSGKAVNQVALAQEVAEPGEVAVSETTLALLRPSDAVYTTERSAGFAILHRLPYVAPPDTPPLLVPALPSQPDIATVELLAAQIDGLRPYLMHSLPKRYIEAEESVELGEFRPVSILFANFSSFSAILESLGAATDLAADILNAYYRRAQAVVHSYGGVVNKVDMSTSGDKLMALFGAPLAHEDDPTRAVRCALDLAKALEEANQEIADWRVQIADRPDNLQSALSNLQFTQRIGINTGTVFAGRVGPPERHEYTVMGPAVNLAARLMGKADEGAVIMSPSTRRAVEQEIAVAPLPAVQLKGLAEPVVPALALHPRSEGRTERRGDEDGLRRAPLVAREEELGRCLDHSSAALGDSGGVLALVGVAGIGKTRLMQELLLQLTLGSHGGTVPSFGLYLGDCQSYEGSTPYAAVRGLLHYLLDLDTRTGRDGAQIAAHIENRVLRFAPDMARFAPLLGDLLGIVLPDTPLTAQLSAEQRHDRAQELVVALLRGRMGGDGMLLVIDDLHWADPSSLELLRLLARAAGELRLLLVFCYRLDQRIAEPWLELPNALRVELRELPAAGSQTLAEALLNGPLPSELTALLDRTEGNPFFIEEMLRDLLATHTLVRDAESGKGNWRLARPLASLVLPDSIEGVLTAQLDRLAERSRDLVQVAAVIGRRFLYTILSGIYTQRALLESSLRQLAESDIILAEELERDLAYLFRHTLVRDVAYESILYARRRELHARVATRIVGLYGADAPDQVPLLARHYLLAEEWPAAFHYHWLAGYAAQRRYANREALDLFTQALAIAPNLAPRQIEQEIEILERIGTIAQLMGDYEYALASFQLALKQLATTTTQSSEQVVRLHRLIAATHERRADFDAAFDWLNRAVERTDSNSLNERARCYLLRAGLLQRQGKFHECLEWARLGLELAEEIGSPHDQAKGYKLLGGTFCSLGDLDQAITPTEQCLQFYTDVGDVQEQAGAHINLGNILYDLGRWDEARREYESAVALTTEIGNTYEQALAANNLGEVLRSQGDAEEASRQYRRALAGWRHSPFHSALALMNLGATAIQQGDLVFARERLDQSAQLFAQVGSDSFSAELLRYRAELALVQGDTAAAITYCEESISLAQQQEAPLEEARSERVLGQALLREGKVAEASIVLEKSFMIVQELQATFDIARTHLWLAAVHLGRCDSIGGLGLLQEAHTVLERLGARYDLALAHDLAARHGLALQATVIVDA